MEDNARTFNDYLKKKQRKKNMSIQKKKKIDIEKKNNPCVERKKGF